MLLGAAARSVKALQSTCAHWVVCISTLGPRVQLLLCVFMFVCVCVCVCMRCQDILHDTSANTYLTQRITVMPVW